jgi:hypothetical protein
LADSGSSDKVRFSPKSKLHLSKSVDSMHIQCPSISIPFVILFLLNDRVFLGLHFLERENSNDELRTLSRILPNTNSICDRLVTWSLLSLQFILIEFDTDRLSKCFRSSHGGPYAVPKFS